MNQPKYNEGNHVGVWKIANVYYRGEQFGYVYELERVDKTRKFQITCTENVLDQIVNNSQSA